jgi:tyrosine ammonia-lyase
MSAAPLRDAPGASSLGDSTVTQPTWILNPRVPVQVQVGSGIDFGPERRLDCETLERAALDDAAQFAFTDGAIAGMERSRDTLDQLHRDGAPIYGLTTGFGPFVTFGAARGADHGAGLLNHLCAGWGNPAPRRIVRIMMMLRCQSIAQGTAGIDPTIAHAFLDLLGRGICPLIPEIGSVGASGDLIPLAHAARVLVGEGHAITDDGSVITGRDALRQAGLEPIALCGRDALALVNGTSFMSAYAVEAIARAERLIARAERLTGWAYRLLGCRTQALDERLHEARGHAGQFVSASLIAEEAAADGDREDTARPLQEVYSLRCAPQVLGAARDNLEHARTIVEREINGVNDNPVVACGENPAALHGGNFQGQQIAFAADALNAALVQVGVLMERQLDVLLNPEFNNNAPLLLAWEPGPCSGMAGAQITATATVAEMRHHGLPSATASIPTNGRNQDVVSMGTLAARAAHGQTDRLARILAIHGMALRQLNFLREQDRAPGSTTATPTWFPRFDPFTNDRPLFEDTERIARALLTLKAA